MDISPVVVAAYGLFVLVGGVMGYVKANSKISFFTGLISGIVLLACSYGIQKSISLAVTVSLALSFLLGTRFLMTWFKTRRLMPDLLMIVFSFIAFMVVSLMVMNN